MTGREEKLLWARSGNRCAICLDLLTVDVHDDRYSVIGHEAHIIARHKSGPRGEEIELTDEERDQYSNYILLCSADHKIVDDHPDIYPVDRLRQMKLAHELLVEAAFNSEIVSKRKRDRIYWEWIQEWERSAELKSWREWTELLLSPANQLYSRLFDSLNQLAIRIDERAWYGDYPSVEDSLKQFGKLAASFVLEYRKHSEPIPQLESILRTQKFYKSYYGRLEFEQKENDYRVHNWVIELLVRELTKSANVIIYSIRSELDSNYRSMDGYVSAIMGPDDEENYMRYTPVPDGTAEFAEFLGIEDMRATAKSRLGPPLPTRTIPAE